MIQGPSEDPGSELFARFARGIAHLPEGARFDDFCSNFLLDVEGALEVFYAPFDYVNRAAKIVLVGITPGPTQVEIAFRVARESLRRGLPLISALARVKEQSSFAGPMRRILVQMLDHIGLNAWLDIASCESLFRGDSNLLHSTSAVRYPVFVNQKAYSGRVPRLAAIPLLCAYVRRYLGGELAAMPLALVISLGRSAESALDLLIRDGGVSKDRCLRGLPHPSPANGHRKREFEKMHEVLAEKAAGWFAVNPL